MSTPTENPQRAIRGGGCFNRKPNRLRASVWRLFCSEHHTNCDAGFRTFRPSRQPHPAP